MTATPRIRDLVPAALRARWVRAGYCPGRDVHALFREQARAHPGQDAVIDAERSLDYAALDREVDRIAAALDAAGVAPGDVVGLRMRNGWRLVVSELAVAAVGGVVLAYPADRGDRDTRGLLGRSRATAAIFGDPGDADGARALPHLRWVFTFGAGESGARSLDAAPASGWAARPVDAEAPVRILVTSGSEAEPKMIAYSHNAMAGGRANYVRALAEVARPGGPMRALVLMPLSSSYGSLVSHVAIAALGATAVLADRFDPDSALELVTRHRPGHLFGVPTMLRRLADRPPIPGEDLTSLVAVVSSSAPLSEVTARSAERRLGARVINVYGSSDGINCHTARTPGEPGAGLPDPSVAELRVVDERGVDVPPGTSGEILARGPMTPLSYVAAPELDARHRTADGWVRSGDRGLFDEHGRLHVLGRLRLVVSRGGRHISPAEVEREIAAHPSVLDVVCVGVPDADLGERLCACLSVAPGGGGSGSAGAQRVPGAARPGAPQAAGTAAGAAGAAAGTDREGLPPQHGGPRRRPLAHHRTWGNRMTRTAAARVDLGTSPRRTGSPGIRRGRAEIRPGRGAAGGDAGAGFPAQRLPAPHRTSGRRSRTASPGPAWRSCRAGRTRTRSPRASEPRCCSPNRSPACPAARCPRSTTGPPPRTSPHRGWRTWCGRAP
ncbi:class I adenylate-forming enzyme family protein [Saccharopolyspora sp. MS10]|uniref:class I adenylate-forming enzyme family protein n=1 Tax=Saccharopolyspora sp. MS10 TaxID=3385973 RepID=UPI0039A25AA2